MCIMEEADKLICMFEESLALINRKQSRYSNTYNINEVGDALRNAYQDFNKLEDKTHKYSHIPILKNKKI